MIVIFTPNGSSFNVNYQGETFTKGDDTAHTIYAIVKDDSINSTNFQGFVTFRREDLESSDKMPMAYGYVDFESKKYKCFKFEMQNDWYTAVAGALATTIEIRQYLQTGAIRNKAFGVFNIPIQDSVVKDFDTSITKEEYNAMMKLLESLIVEANPNTTGNEEALLSLRVHNENFEIKRTLFNFSEAVTEATAKVLRQITIDGDAWKIPEFKIDLAINGTSLNAVANKAVKDYVDSQIQKLRTQLTPDGTMSDTSANSVQNKVIKAYIDNLIRSTDTSLRTNINLVRQDSLKYADNVEKVCKAYTDGKVTKNNLLSVIGEATSSMSGLMSPVDKASIDVLKAMIAQDNNNIVDKLQEVLAIFSKYPEGTDLFTLLSEKANKEDVYTKDEVDVLKEDVESKITLDYGAGITAVSATEAFDNLYFNEDIDYKSILSQITFKNIEVPVNADGSSTYTLKNACILQCYKSKNYYSYLVLSYLVSTDSTLVGILNGINAYNGLITRYQFANKILLNKYTYDFYVTNSKLDSIEFVTSINDYEIGTQNELLKNLISTTPFKDSDKLQKNITLNPVVNGRVDKSVVLYPKTTLENVFTNDGNPIEETELELSDSEPSANAKELKKVLMNGTEWKVTGSGGGEEVLVLNVTSVENPIYVDDATHQKIINKKVPRIRLVMPQTQEIDIAIDCQLNTTLSQGALGSYSYIGWFQFITLTLAVVYYDSSNKAFVYQGNIEYAKGGSIRDMQGSGNSLGTSTIVDGELTFRIYTDNETLENDTYLCKTKAVKAYVDSKIEESVTTALSDDYTIGG